jgi:uncharacterized membrane protein
MRKLLLILAFFVFGNLLTNASAQLSFCNKTYKDVYSIVMYFQDGNWMSKGWYIVSPSSCSVVIGGNLKNRYYYYYANRSDGVKWSGGSDSPVACKTTSVFEFKGTPSGFSQAKCKADGGEAIPVRKIDTGESRAYTLDLTFNDEPETKVGEINSRCIASWDDSFQVHSVDTIITWNYQAIKTTMKKLRHCIKLTLVGPVDIAGVAKDYVNHCINVGVNNQKVRYIVQLIASIALDVASAGGTGGGATAATVADYVRAAADATVACLTDTQKISAYLGDRLKQQFNASVQETSEWIYWEL